MALDHYVSQVHLRNFYSPILNGKKMYGVQKRSLKQFPCGSEDVCRIDEGNTNQFLQHERAIEKFLSAIEPRYNASLDKFRSQNVDPDCVFVVSGFISYVMSCAPAAVRLSEHVLAKTLESTAAIMDAKGKFETPPEIFGGESLTELLENGTIKFNIDSKYPHALGVQGILDRVVTFGNFDWDIIHNGVSDSPFFTSDYPVAIERSLDHTVFNRIVPLAPDLAIRIRPERDRRVDRSIVSFPMFGCRHVEASRREVIAINELLVQCAEELVFFRDDRPWVIPFVKKRAGYWIEPVAERVSVPTGELIWSSMRIAKR